MILRYQAALLHLRRSARDLAEAFVDVARVAREMDPEGRAAPDPLAQQTFGEVAALLGAAARIPGVREVLFAALAQHKEP